MPVIVQGPQDDRASAPGDTTGPGSTADFTDSIAGIENIEGSGLGDTLYGNGADNRIAPGAGNDVVDGRGGVDTIDYSAARAGVEIRLDVGEAFETGTGETSFDPFSGSDIFGITIEADDFADSTDQLAGIENAVGSAFDDALVGDDGANRLEGGDGDDLIDGGDGNDELLGGAGNDTLGGGDGDDIVRGGDGQDLIVLADEGTEVAEGGAGNDALVVAWGGAGSVTMTAPAADPGGGYSGTISASGRSITYSGIEDFSIATGSGDDVVRGGGNNNFISLGAGADHYVAAPGSFNSVDGGDGLDGLTATYTAGNIALNLITGTLNGVVSYLSIEYFVSLTTGSGQDSIGTANFNLNDNVILGSGNDTVSLWNGQDIVNGGAAADGGANTGFDTLILNYGQATNGVHNIGALDTSAAAGASGQIGDDATRLATFQAIDRFLIVTGTGNDNITTFSGNDDIRTGGGNDILDAGGGNDLLDGGTGDDMMTGGTGNDIYFVGSAADVVVENAGEGTDEIRSFLAVHSLLGTNVENLTAANAVAHDFRGSAANNVMTGSNGNELIRLQDGGDDTALGFDGSDVFYFGAGFTGADSVDGGAGRDVLILQGSYTLTLSGADINAVESVSLQSGARTTWGDTANNFYSYNITAADDLIAGGQELIVNAQSLRVGENFIFNGSAEESGRFLVYGGFGSDQLTGGGGNDAFFFEGSRWGAFDSANGGGGRDALIISGNTGVNHIEFLATSLASIESISLNARYAADPSQKPSYEIVMHDNNVAAGETMIVNGISLIDPTQTVNVDGSAETNGNFIMFGGAGNDVLKGGAGGDLLYAAGGADDLTGGGGADTFQYRSSGDSTTSGRDDILDFQSGVDKIDVSLIDANTATAGDQAFAWIGSNAFSGAAGELRAFENNGIWFVEGDTNGDGVADLVIAVTTQGNAALVQGDFLP